MANVTEMPPVDDSEIDNPATEPIPQAQPQPSRPSRGRPPKGQHRPPDAQQPQFFDRVASVPKEDWGVRAFMYVYADEPVCNKKTFGETRYILKSSAPILDLERLKQDYGSFKGWMSLNLRKTGKDATDEVDRLNFEIYDPKHPPKIPRSAWANDDRNKRWADLLPPETPPAPIPAGLAEFTGVFRAASELRKEIRDEMTPPAAPAETRTDPLTASLTIAREILQIRSDNPMVDVLRDELKGLRDEMKEERAENRKLQEEIRKAQTAPSQTQPAAAPKSLLEQATELAEAAGKLKSIFGAASETGAAGTIVRAARMGTLEFLSEVIPKIADSQILNAIAVRMLTATPTPTDGITGPPAPSQPQPALHPNPQADFENFMRFAITPALVQAMADKDTGARFAEWVWDYYPNRLEQLQKFTHPRLPGLMGPAAIIMAYRNSSVWPTLAMNGEEAFQIFVKDFCEWKSPEDQASEPEAAAPPASGEPIDLDEETKESV